MKTKLDKDETLLKGEWLVENKKVIGNEICNRIEFLTSKVLKKIISSGQWTTLYYDESDGRFWELFYEHGDYHGGGPQSLRCISKTDVIERYKLLLNEETSIGDTKKALSAKETYLGGKWVLTNGQITEDIQTRRINYLVTAILEKIAIQPSLPWNSIYRDNADGRYWELHYEYGEWLNEKLEGGGPPSLKNISEAEAKEKRKV